MCFRECFLSMLLKTAHNQRPLYSGVLRDVIRFSVPVLSPIKHTLTSFADLIHSLWLLQYHSKCHHNSGWTSLVTCVFVVDDN